MLTSRKLVSTISSKSLGVMLAFVLVTAFSLSDAHATAQWARKYKLACSTCHTAFPRLNYYGERFLMNAYQDPDNSVPDGSTEGKEVVNEDFAIDKVGNWLGGRLNLDLARYQTDKLTIDGKTEDKFDFGNPNWLQFFVAGSIFKNLSIFIESEFEQDHFKFSWFYFTLPKLFGSSLVNFQAGQISPLEFASVPNRLRIFAAVKGDVYGVKSSGGANGAADSLTISGFRPGLQYYGHTGPLVWWAGISAGKGREVNDRKHYWTGLKFVVPESWDSALEGSSVTGWWYLGDDSNTGDALATTEAHNQYQRVAVQGNLRVSDLDVQLSYIDAHDDNWDLNPVSDTNIDFDGWSIIAAYQAGKFYPAVGYDTVNSSDVKSLEKELVTLSLGYSVRENFRVTGYARLDTQSGKSTDAHDFFINIRTMF